MGSVELKSGLSLRNSADFSETFKIGSTETIEAITSMIGSNELERTNEAEGSTNLNVTENLYETAFSPSIMIETKTINDSGSFMETNLLDISTNLNTEGVSFSDEHNVSPDLKITGLIPSVTVNSGIFDGSPMNLFEISSIFTSSSSLERSHIISISNKHLTTELSGSKMFCNESALILLTAAIFASLDVADTVQMSFTNSLTDSVNLDVSLGFSGTAPLKTITILPSIAFDVAGNSKAFLGSVSLALTLLISNSDSLNGYTEKLADSNVLLNKSADLLLQKSFPYDLTGTISISIQPPETFQFGITNLFADSVNRPQSLNFPFSHLPESPEIVDSITLAVKSEYLTDSLPLRLTASISLSDSLNDYTVEFSTSIILSDESGEFLLRQSFPYDLTAPIFISTPTLSLSVKLSPSLHFPFSLHLKSPDGLRIATKSENTTPPLQTTDFFRDDTDVSFSSPLPLLTLIDVSMTVNVAEDSHDGTQLLPGTIVGIVVGVIAVLSLVIVGIVRFLQTHSDREMSVEHNSEEHSIGELSSTVNFTGLDDDDDAVSFMKQEATDGTAFAE
jgi:hypothetical protein